MDYECVLDIENQSVVVDASVEPDITKPSVFLIMCQPYQVRTYFSLCGTFYSHASSIEFLFTEVVIESSNFDLSVIQLPK